MIPEFLHPITRPFHPYYLHLVWEPKFEPFTKMYYPRYVSFEDVVIEVGALIGASTRFLSYLSKHVYSFEPNKRNFRLLRSYTKKLENVQVYNVALGNHNGEVYLNIDAKKDYAASSSLSNTAKGKYSGKQKVRISKLDDFGFPLAPTVLILDCEGAEVDVLRGARNTIPNLKSILVETHLLANGKNTIDDVNSQLSTYEQFESKLVTAGHEKWIIASNKRFLSSQLMYDAEFL